MYIVRTDLYFEINGVRYLFKENVFYLLIFLSFFILFLIIFYNEDESGRTHTQTIDNPTDMERYKDYLKEAEVYKQPNAVGKIYLYTDKELKKKLVFLEYNHKVNITGVAEDDQSITFSVVLEEVDKNKTSSSIQPIYYMIPLSMNVQDVILIEKTRDIEAE